MQYGHSKIYIYIEREKERERYIYIYIHIYKYIYKYIYIYIFFVCCVHTAQQKWSSCQGLNCPILIGIMSQASTPNQHELIFGKDRLDLTGVLACSTSYHVCHSLKFGKLSLIRQAIESGRFSQVRAYAFSAAKAFLNDFDIQSNGIILKCGGISDLSRDVAYGYQAGTLVGSPVPLAPDLTNSSDQAVFIRHSQGNPSPDN